MRIGNIEAPVCRKVSAPVLSLLAAWLSCTRDAYGYLDPGTGSYVLQLIIAFFIGALYTSKMIRAKIFAIFRAVFSRKKHVHKSNKRPGQS